MKFKHLRIKFKFRNYENLRSFIITKSTQIILSKLKYINMIIAYISVKPCLQIQSKIDCP